MDSTRNVSRRKKKDKNNLFRGTRSNKNLQICEKKNPKEIPRF